MGVVFSACPRRGGKEGDLSDFGISTGFQWDGLQEDRINDYDAAESKMFEEYQEKLKLDAEDEGWIQKLPASAQKNLEMPLMRRAIGLVHVLKPIEQERSGIRKMQSRGFCSADYYASFENAELQCTEELKVIREISHKLYPNHSPNFIFGTSVRLYDLHGMEWPQGSTGGTEADKDPPPPFTRGQKVMWSSTDSDIEKGEVGEVVGGLENGSVRVKFKKGCWAFPRHELLHPDGKHVVEKPPSNDRTEEPPPPFKNGQEVKWESHDADIPEGEVGAVDGGMTNGSVRVKFNTGTWVFGQHELLHPDGSHVVEAPPPVVHKDAVDVPTFTYDITLKRPKKANLGIDFGVEEQFVFIKSISADGFAAKFNAGEVDETMRLKVGDRIVAVKDGSAPPSTKPLGGNGKEILRFILKDNNAVTPLFLIVSRALGPPLRYKQGQRVKANCGEDGWLPGVVIDVWVGKPQKKPYAIFLETLNRTVFAPKDSDDCIKRGDPRFKVGDKVMANRGGGYGQAKVVEVKESTNGVGYRLEVGGSKDNIMAPEDLNQFLRPVARFKKGDKILANVDDGFKPGVIEEVYHPMWAYAIRLKDGKTVTAPEDRDAFVRKA